MPSLTLWLLHEFMLFFLSTDSNSTSADLRTAVSLRFQSGIPSPYQPVYLIDVGHGGVLQPSALSDGGWESHRDTTATTEQQFLMASFQHLFPSVLWHCLLGNRKGIRPVKKTRCWFVGSDDLTGALHDLWLQLSPPLPSSFASINTG